MDDGRRQGQGQTHRPTSTINRQPPAVLVLIYRLLQAVAWVGARVFYRELAVLSRANLRFDGPAIVIVNHPSTLMDVLNPGAHIRRLMFFLANYGLFKNPVSNWLLRRLFCIPVKRREDVAEGEARNNDGAFEASFQHMEGSGTLFIAAEGVSWMNRFVRPLKTGTARIAFGAEARNDWQLGVKIIPVGLSYDAPHKFRSRVVVQAGQPIWAKDWAEKHRADPDAAIDDLTQYLENQLKTLSIHTRDEAGEQFITQLETLARTARPLPLAADFERTQQLVRQHLDDAPLRAATADYFSELEKSGISDAGLAAALSPNFRQRQLTDGLVLLVAAPFWLVAGAFWLLPCGLPYLVEKRLKLYIGYGATVKFLVGLFTFPLAFWAAYRVAAGFFQNQILAWATLAALFLSGLFLEKMLDRWARFRAGRKARRLPRPVLENLWAKRPAGF